MQKSVKISVEREGSTIIISNDGGKIWRFDTYTNLFTDSSATGMVASLMASMLAGTINSHLQHSKSRKLEYTLTLNTAFYFSNND